MQLNITDTFNQELPADPSRENVPRPVREACFSYVTPKVPGAPKLLHVSPEMVKAVGLDLATTNTPEFLKMVTGAEVQPGTEPYAMCYGGHQFGNWAGQLGDGRAINLFEVTHAGQRWALQLKGAGETPYSRRADGLAVLRSSIREHLCSEAMFHLGVPTTRSLSLSLSGDQVLRDMLYDGNSAYEKGAIVCRVAPSFIRFGSFQIFAARKDVTTLRQLTDYTIRHFYPGIAAGTKEGYLEFFRQVTERTLDMVLEWQRVGFVHGVMNTDNMSALGLTIDYGPYGWLEGYDDGWTPNTTDRNGRRYRFGYQPMIAQWNLAQLGSALVRLIESTEELQAILDGYREQYAGKYLAMMRRKLGWQQKRQ
ncbi:MAG: YdiU family protein, partial [Bacteroidota bacterium]